MNRRTFFKAMGCLLVGAVAAPKSQGRTQPQPTQAPLATSPYEVILKMEEPAGSVHIHGPNHAGVQAVWDEVYQGVQRGLAKIRGGKGVYYGISRSGV